MFFRSSISLAIRLAIACIFGYAGLQKLTHNAEFASTIDGYDIFADSVVTIVAAYVPWLELVIGAALMFSPTITAACWCSQLLCAGFVSVAAVTLIRRQLFICACFGETIVTSPWSIIARAIILGGLAECLKRMHTRQP